jgi:hypothetical protein
MDWTDDGFAMAMSENSTQHNARRCTLHNPPCLPPLHRSLQIHHADWGPRWWHAREACWPPGDCGG